MSSDLFSRDIYFYELCFIMLKDHAHIYTLNSYSLTLLRSIKSNQQVSLVISWIFNSSFVNLSKITAYRTSYWVILNHIISVTNMPPFCACNVTSTNGEKTHLHSIYIVHKSMWAQRYFFFKFLHQVVSGCTLMQTVEKT